MEDSRLKYNILLESDDYVYHDFHSFFGKGNVVRKVIMSVSTTIVIFALVTVTLRFWYLFPLTAVIIFYPLLLKYMAKYRFKSYLGRKLREQLVYTIDKQGIVIDGESFSNSYLWSDFKEITEGKKAFYFWETDAFALLLPKRYLSDSGMNFIRKVRKIK